MKSKRSDLIFLEGMRFYAFHGNNVEERSLGQPFVVDLEAKIDLLAAGISDELSDTVSYTHLYKVVKSEMEASPKSLLESVANSIAQKILDSYPIDAIKVRIKKTNPPIKGAFLSGAGVEVVRVRTGHHDSDSAKLLPL